MDLPDPALALALAAVELKDHRGARQHRYMESADFNAAFRELFPPLRTSIRQGLSNPGQLYGIEMDACIPGEMLATEWIPPATRGIADTRLLADPARRRAVFARLLAEARHQALFAYICERAPADGAPGTVVYLEIVSADGGQAAEFPVRAGRGWRRRELVLAEHRRIAPG